jgi:hypothetical protein
VLRVRRAELVRVPGGAAAPELADGGRRAPRPRWTGLSVALGLSLLLALGTVAWLAAFADYYLLPPDRRGSSRWHELLRPSGPIGLAFGVAATLLILANLAYLVRRGRWGARLPGSLRGWMSAHIVTGILATLLVVLHGAMAPRNTLGGQAFAAMVLLLATGAAGRYLYALVPRAANGRELRLDEVRARLAAERDLDGRGLDDAVRAEIEALARRHERLRALLASWRFVHRWMALLMVLLAGWHILTALRFGGLFG